jgi:hypothetical protein
MADEYRIKRWGSHIDGIMTEIGRQALICKVRLLDPGVIDAVLKGNDSVCGSRNPASFKKLKELLEMGFLVKEKAYDRLGVLEAEELVKAVRETLRERFGDKLGGPPAGR